MASAATAAYTVNYFCITRIKLSTGVATNQTT